MFRLPSGTDPQLALGRPTLGDLRTVTYGGLRIDKTYSLQHLNLDIVATRSRYNTFTHLDFDGVDYRGTWDWKFTPRWSGALTLERVEAPVQYADFRSFQRNVRVTTNQEASLDYWAFGGWHLLGGITEKEQKSEVDFLAETDFRVVGPDAGIKYEWPSGSSLALKQHARRGENTRRELDPVNLIDTAFRDTETELVLSWRVSGPSTIDARLARYERRNDHFSQRDFSGPVGGVTWSWIATGKLRLVAAAKRELMPSSDSLSSYRVNNSITLTPSLQMTEKTSVRLVLERIDSDFRGPVVTPTGPLRHDVLHTTTLAADWVATRKLTVNAVLQRQTRTANTPGADYEATTATLSAGLVW